MSTVTSADGTIIDYDAYGEGSTVIFVGGASQHRAIDQRTTEIAKQLAAKGFTAVDYDRAVAIDPATHRPGRWPRARRRRGLDRSHRSARRPLHKLLRRRNRTGRGDSGVGRVSACSI
jgi:hypothetical protein